MAFGNIALKKTALAVKMRFSKEKTLHDGKGLTFYLVGIKCFRKLRIMTLAICQKKKTYKRQIEVTGGIQARLFCGFADKLTRPFDSDSDLTAD